MGGQPERGLGKEASFMAGLKGEKGHFNSHDDISRMCYNATVAVCTKETATFCDNAANNIGNNLPIIWVLKSKKVFCTTEIACRKII